MNITERSLKNYVNHSLTDKSFSDELLEKTEVAIKDGLFDHHVSFGYARENHFYYFEFFGHGWNKRKINKDGWIKYLNSLAYNVYTCGS